MIETLRIRVEDSSAVGHARRQINEFCRDLLLPFSEEDLGNIALLSTELGTNLVKHAGSGELVVHPLRLHEAVGLQILAIDHGPGFKEGYNKLEEGKSSAGTLGYGLGGIRRIAKVFDFISLQGKGVILVCQYWPAAMQIMVDAWDLPFGGVNVPKPGETVSGDCWTIEMVGDRYRIFFADGLGHGIGASEAATQAAVLFKKYKTKPLEDLVRIVHQGLQSSRGAVLAIMEVDLHRHTLIHIGVGNISSKIITATKQQSLLSANGTVGFQINKLYINEVVLAEKSFVILHSDGIGSHWDSFAFDTLWEHHPSVVAGLLYHTYARTTDDASCVIIKCPGVRAS
jgi:anti-sigma regulatory factor (Ser/Thr protein kinase)